MLITSEDLVFYLTDRQVEDALTNMLDGADADMLARLAAELLGGTCEYNEKLDKYVFVATPEEYCGAFGYSPE